MDCIILAAGKGTRLQPHTLSTPKPLLPVQGRPILDWIISALPPVDRLIVVVNYLEEQIKDYLAQQKHVKNWCTVRQEQPLGTGDALMSCKSEVKSDRVMVLNGDDLIGRKDLKLLGEVPMGILAHPVQTPKDFGIIFRGIDGTLKEIIEKPQGLAPPQLANIGGYVFPKRAFDFKLTKSPRGEYEITEVVSLLAASGAFHVVEASYWLPIGTVEAWEASQTADISPV